MDKEKRPISPLQKVLTSPASYTHIAGGNYISPLHTNIEIGVVSDCFGLDSILAMDFTISYGKSHPSYGKFWVSSIGYEPAKEILSAKESGMINKK